MSDKEIKIEQARVMHEVVIVQPPKGRDLAAVPPLSPLALKCMWAAGNLTKAR